VTDPDFRCSAASLLRDEPLAGSATYVRGFLLLEHTGPWGQTALLDARLPDGLGEALRRTAQGHRIKVLLVRRHRARRDPDRLTVLAAHTSDVGARLEAGTVGDLREVLDLDLSGLATGRPTGLPANDDHVFAVCTNGRHDACCAELGRPIASALSRAQPDQTWEVSHIGGDRFAANVLVLPRGLYYGRLDAPTAIAMAGSHLSGHLDLDHLRGSTTAPMPVQAAEIALRHQLAETRIDAVRLAGRSVDGGLTRARFEVGAASYDVEVRTTAGPPTRLTCQALRDNQAPVHEVLSITEVSAG
jgi:hypothetical protein